VQGYRRHCARCSVSAAPRRMAQLSRARFDQSPVGRFVPPPIHGGVTPSYGKPILKSQRKLFFISVRRPCTNVQDSHRSVYRSLTNVQWSPAREPSYSPV
jgi:hypothetical protein